MTVHVDATGAGQDVQVGMVEHDGAIGNTDFDIVEESTGADVMLCGIAVLTCELLSAVCERSGSSVEAGEEPPNEPVLLFDKTAAAEESMPLFDPLIVPATILPTILFAALITPPTTPVA